VRKLTPIPLLVAAVALLAGCGGSSGTSSAPRSTTTHRAAVRQRPHRPKPKSSLVRNAAPQPGWRPYTGPVPILVYHELGNPPASEPYPGLYVSDSDFIAEMQWLHSHGWQAVTLDEMMRAWYHGGTLPAKPIVITFDNGYPPQVTFAPSVMSKYGWPGVLNEITAGHLHNNQIESVLKLGWEVDSHSVTHPDLTTLTPGELRYQLVASRRFLRKTFHIPANSFCYPSSRYNDSVIAAVKAAGYTNAVTENSGYATSADPYVLNRFEIEGGVSELAADLGNGP
jgi:peptidoglycan/xylan/chitin deacetylase (PgdA/CDA1 family)